MGILQNQTTFLASDGDADAAADAAAAANDSFSKWWDDVKHAICNWELLVFLSINNVINYRKKKKLNTGASSKINKTRHRTTPDFRVKYKYRVSTLIMRLICCALFHWHDFLWELTAAFHWFQISFFSVIWEENEMKRA